MIVVTINNCPPKLRGDLSKWLFEINTGVFVGNVNARVRERLWERICENIEYGQATMVYSAKNEQHMEFRIHNSAWEPTDFDGLTLIKRPLPGSKQKSQEELKEGFSKASKRRMGRRRKNDSEKKKYAFLDIETTGLDRETDEIIEIGVVCTEGMTITERWSTLIRVSRHIPECAAQLTGISDAMTAAEGIDLSEALALLKEKLSNRVTVIYNASFDMAFLRRAEKRIGCSIGFGRVIDALTMAKKIDDIPDHKLATIANLLGIDVEEQHRAINDCELLCKVFFKLNEI